GEPPGSDRLPSIGVSLPTGYSSAGCSPAEPASASPVADNSTSNPGPARQSKCAAQPHYRDPVQVTLLVHVTTGVSSLLCAPGDISILRRQRLSLTGRMPHEALGVWLDTRRECS